jgi:hypothetical protein
MAQDTEQPPEAVTPLSRKFAFKIDFGIGGFSPDDVNHYIKQQVPSNAVETQGFSEMVLLLSLDASGAYFPVRFLGIRPNLVYLFAPKVVSINGDSRSYWLHSLAPGVAVDFVVDRGGAARFFASPGIAYQFAWFEGYGANGLGLELALGTELSFGRRRAKGISLALVLRAADLDVKSGPAPSFENPASVNTLDFSSVMFRVGFQLGA